MGNRRGFLKGGTASALGLLAPSVLAGKGTREGLARDGKPLAARRPVLYNADENDFLADDYRLPEKIDRSYLDGWVARLASSGVTIFSNGFYDGGRCWYDTKVGERFDADPNYISFSPAEHRFIESGDVSFWMWLMTTHYRDLLAAGNDPIRVFAQACHGRNMTFLAGLRMNDRHKIHVDNPPRLIRQRPELVLKVGGKPIGGMDFQYPEVRDFVFAVMEEMATEYDIDGLELDWLRYPRMFSDDVPVEKRNAVMTDYHGRIRTMLDGVGKRKGKKLLLSVRVPPTLAECHTVGFDVQTYVRDGLIDILCPSDMQILDPRMPVSEFKPVTQGSKVLLLPSLHGVSGYKSGNVSTENYRAVGHSYYRQGADGISVYNWRYPELISVPADFVALKELGDPALLARLPREYLFNPMYGNGSPSDTGRIIDYQTKVSRSAVGKREVYPLRIKENPAQVRMSLSWKIEHFTAEDQIRLDINGTPVAVSECKLSTVPNGKAWMTRFLSSDWEAEYYYDFELPHAERWLKDGDNEIGITLVRPNPLLDLPFTIFEARVRVQPK